MPSHPVFWGSAPGLGSQCLQAQHWRGAHGSGSWEGAERRRGNGNARHPPPEEASQLLCGGGSRAQTQTDRFKHTQTDSDTHRNPHAQRALPFPWGTHPRSIEGMSSQMWPALSRVTAPFLKKGAMKDLKGAFLERPEGRQGSLDQLRRGGVLRRGGLKGSAPARLRSCWYRFSGLLPPPRGWLCSRAGW